MPISEIFSNINDMKSKRNLIAQEIEQKKIDLEDLKKTHSKMVANEVGRKRKSGGLTAQRSKIENLNKDITELEDADKELEKQLHSTEEELQNVRDRELFESFNQNNAQFLNTVKRCKDCLVEFNRLVDSLACPLERILSTLNRLRTKVSLPDFFEKQEIKEPDSDKNQKFIDNLLVEYGALFDGVPENINLTKFQEQIRYAISVAKAIQSGARGISGSNVEARPKQAEIDPLSYIRRNPERYAESDRQRVGL